MIESRDWREAKLPQWARDAVQSEIDQWRLTAALSWPTEAKPEPLPFHWGDYGRLTGTPVSGRYWSSNSRYVSHFLLAEADEIPQEDQTRLAGFLWKRWVFKLPDIGTWSPEVVRGPLFASEREARMYRRWLMCEEFARKLMSAME